MTKAFMPNFNVQSVHVICPAVDVSEKNSTADLGASVSGNMKFMLNGASAICLRDDTAGRAIGEYCDVIWNVPPVEIHLD